MQLRTIVFLVLWLSTREQSVVLCEQNTTQIITTNESVSILLFNASNNDCHTEEILHGAQLAVESFTSLNFSVHFDIIECGPETVNMQIITIIYHVI